MHSAKPNGPATFWQGFLLPKILPANKPAKPLGANPADGLKLFYRKLVCKPNIFFVCLPDILAPMKPEETVDYNIKVCWHAISRMYNTQAAKHDITTSIGFVLLNIDQENGTPATKIAPLLGLETRSLTRILRSMEERGLIYKQADTQDKRSVRIFLTEEGLRGKEISRQTVRHFNQKVREKIPQAQLETLFKVVGQINAMIESKSLFDDFMPKPLRPETTSA